MLGPLVPHASGSPSAQSGGQSSPPLLALPRSNQEVNQRPQKGQEPQQAHVRLPLEPTGLRARGQGIAAGRARGGPPARAQADCHQAESTTGERSWGRAAERNTRGGRFLPSRSDPRVQMRVSQGMICANHISDERPFMEDACHVSTGAHLHRASRALWRQRRAHLGVY